MENTTKFNSENIDLRSLNVKSVISQGSISSVFKASYNGQEVVVKVLVVEQVCQRVKDSVKILFDQEILMWSNLDHPNIIKLIGASSDLYYMISEYLPGGTLKAHLYRNCGKKLSLSYVIILALDLARGLSYLHSQMIVHGDVKTENMLLDENGHLKIADFGVARLVSMVQGKMIGQTGMQGHVARPPEVVKGKPYDTKSDVYSFGICLWEIYCCGLPFSPTSKDSRPEIPKCCPKSLAKIMKRCWSSNPKKRPQMKDVVSNLERMRYTDQAQCSCFFPQLKQIK